MNFIIAPNGTTLLGYFCNQNLSPNTIKRHPIWSHWPLVRAYNVHPLAKCYFWGRVVVVVLWSACSPSSPTILVQIPLKLQFFWNEKNKKRSSVPIYQMLVFVEYGAKDSWTLEYASFHLQWKVDDDQCDQIGQFIGLWASFKSLWQQLFCPNLPCY